MKNADIIFEQAFFNVLLYGLSTNNLLEHLNWVLDLMKAVGILLNIKLR
jgi:hypothetical protein